LCLSSSSSAFQFFPNFLFGPTTLLTGMTGISLHMRWPLTSQSHGSVSQREQLVFSYGSNSTPHDLTKLNFSRFSFRKCFYFGIADKILLKIADNLLP
jgi:hypothetical protein